MPVFPSLGRGHFIEGSAATSSGQASVSLTSNASANTKATSWSEVITALDSAASGLLVVIGGDALTTNVNFYVDLAVGSAGSEVIFVSNLWMPGSSWADRFHTYYLPVSLPKGARISAKCAASTGSSSVRIAINAFANHWLCRSRAGPVVTYGANTATSNGTAPSPPGSVNNEGAWTQLTASTTAAHRGLIIACGKDSTDITMANAALAFDIGIGGSGSEQELLTDLTCPVNSAADLMLPETIGPLPAPIPKGSRLAIRYRSDSTQTNLHFVAYGVG